MNTKYISRHVIDIDHWNCMSIRVFGIHRHTHTNKQHSHISSTSHMEFFYLMMNLRTRTLQILCTCPRGKWINKFLKNIMSMKFHFLSEAFSIYLVRTWEKVLILIRCNCPSLFKPRMAPKYFFNTGKTVFYYFHLQ